MRAFLFSRDYPTENLRIYALNEDLLALNFLLNSIDMILWLRFF
ncbi:MAG: hypothetical protein ACJAT2_000062 [Bacteriovoracaceae bacterium]|jgi:hypothetical protein